MSYTRSMGSDNPGLFVFLLDQSQSMADPWPSQPNFTKAGALADCINNVLSEIGGRCVRSEGQIAHRCDIAIIGYGGSSGIGSAFQGAFKGQDIVPITDLADSPLETKMVKRKIPDGAGGVTEIEDAFSVWIQAEAHNGTPMKEAFTHTKKVVEDWIGNHKDAFPPIVIHITDGESTDGDPLPEATALTSLATSDGNVLLANCHLPGRPAPELHYPAAETELPQGNTQASLLFQMSSVLPDPMHGEAVAQQLPVKKDSRIMVMNADLTSLITLIQFMSVGTRLR